VLRVEDRRFLTGEARFTADIPLPGARHVVYVGSPAAHARLAGVDTSEARQMPGVEAVVTAADLPAHLSRFPADARALEGPMARPFLAGGTVRYAGEPVAVVVARSVAEARDAADAVALDLDPLPPLLDPRAALDPAAPVLHDGAPGNECFALSPPKGPPIDVDACEVVVEATYRNQRVAPCTIETRAAAAEWSRDGRLTMWATTQGPWPLQRALVALYGVEPDAVRVVSPDVGGGFGAKEALYPEILLLPWLARTVGAPVRWAEDRGESMLNLGHGRAQLQTARLGGTRDGRLLAYTLDVVQDAGAYPRLGATLPFLTRLVQTGPYRIPAASCTGRAVVTTTTPILAYRGAGQPEAVAALERTIDRFAATLGLDPAELRRRNLLAAGDYPYRTAGGATYDSGHPDLAFEQCLDRLGYDRARAAQAELRRAGGPAQLGIGLACFSEVIGGAEPTEFAGVEVAADGTVRVEAGSFSHGQGHQTTWAMVVADLLGVPIEQVRVVDGDTDAVRRGGNTGGSRSVQTVGNAIAEAATRLAEQGRRLAADLLEARVDDVVLDAERGFFHVVGTPAVRRTWGQVAEASTARGERLWAEADAGPPPRTAFSCGAHGAIVEVDTETGRVRLQRVVAVTDAGRILNPLIAEGQIHGGVGQGVGQALTEEMAYDDLGNPLTANFADYGIVSAAELAPVDASFVDLPAPFGPLGAKGLGESGAIGATAAVLNAVVDALGPLGVDDVGLPLTPMRVGEAIDAARRRTDDGG
jgi:carbon-monoxide dehydrogenase large subunit